MFHIEIPSVLLKTIVGCLKEFVECVEITIDSTGIHISTLDQAHICMIKFYISKADCTSFEVNSNNKFRFSIAILEKAIKNAKKNITLSGEKMELKLSYSANSRTLKYSIPCKPKLETKFTIPETLFMGEIQFESKVLADIYSELKNVSEECCLHIEPNGEFSFLASDDIMGKADISLEEKLQFIKAIEDKFEVAFQIDYFGKICKIAKKMHSVQIKPPEKKGDPISFRFNTEKGSQMDFLLASKF